MKVGTLVVTTKNGNCTFEVKNVKEVKNITEVKNYQKNRGILKRQQLLIKKSREIDIEALRKVFM